MAPLGPRQSTINNGAGRGGGAGMNNMVNQGGVPPSVQGGPPGTLHALAQSQGGPGSMMGMQGNGGPSGSGSTSGGVPGMEDGDNRTRNAKAQRRHREKRKAHLKALEDSVQVLTVQLEDARRQLGQAAYYNAQRPSVSGSQSHSAGGEASSPQTKDFAQLQAENAYLRDENADLRRQLYSYRVNFANPSTPIDPAHKQGSGQWEVKPESGGFVGYPQGGVSPGRRDQPPPPNAVEGGPSSASSSSGNYPPIEHFTPIHQRSRSRISTGSGPPVSPYMSADNRPVDGRYPPSGGPMRYEPQTPVYANAPTPHSAGQRYDVSHHSYTPRQDGNHENVSWPPEQTGPPPFSGYPLAFGHEGQAGGEEYQQ